MEKQLGLFSIAAQLGATVEKVVKHYSNLNTTIYAFLKETIAQLGVGEIQQFLLNAHVVAN
jgi:hypothetical protein